MSSIIKINKKMDNEYDEPSESDEEYTERERSLLKKVRIPYKQVDSEEEILPFHDESDAIDDYEDVDVSDQGDHDEIEGFVSDSDLEGGNDNYQIPDSKAWGKKRKDFYSTDFIDQDYDSYTAKEEQLADQEEQEAKEIQQRLSKQLDEVDFTLDAFCSKEKSMNYEIMGQHKLDERSKNSQKTLLKADLSDLPARVQIQLFRKDSPEFEGLTNDFQINIEECEKLLGPILMYLSTNAIAYSTIPILNFTKTMNDLILNYCTNIAFYLVLKARRTIINKHPLVKRLYQMRELIIQLDYKYQTIVKPQLAMILEDINVGKNVSDNLKLMKASSSVDIRKLNALEQLIEYKAYDTNDYNHRDSVYLDETMDSDVMEAKLTSDVANGEGTKVDENNRREITYQMAKNKGLTPYRKKELRNPRVKHRNKFRKAIIRRKGAVRTVRKEIKRYTGEISGIKATVKKGIKIK